MSTVTVIFQNMDSYSIFFNTGDLNKIKIRYLKKMHHHICADCYTDMRLKFGTKARPTDTGRTLRAFLAHNSNSQLIIAPMLHTN